MRAGLPIAAAAVAWLLGPSLALAAWWIGPASADGPVVPPSGYVQAVAGLELERFNFDDIQPGYRIDSAGHGRLILSPRPLQSVVTATDEPIAGAPPASEPIAAMVSEHPVAPSELRLILSEPAISAGFALIGLAPAAQAQVIGSDGAILGTYAIPAERAGMRRWIGITTDGAWITTVRIIPQLPAAYGIDDFEAGRPAPEPATILLLAGLALKSGMRRIHKPCHERKCCIRTD